MRYVYFISCSLLFIPINLTIFRMGGKPVDLVPSDLLFLFLPAALVYFSNNKINRDVFSVLLFSIILFVYCLASIIWYQIDERGSLLSLASFIRSFRPFLLFFVGYYIYIKVGLRVVAWFCFFSLVLCLLLLFSDAVFNGRWPEPRWGGFFFNLPIYGFPNSPAFFYVICISISAYGFFYSGSFRYLHGMSALLMSVIVIFVGSRNAIGALFLLAVILIYFKKIPVRYMLFVVPVSIFGFYYATSSGMDMGLLVSKFHRSLSEGILYGREAVWEDVISIALQRPLLGFGYSPLSGVYALHGTAHNQYIGYVYKMGILGLILVSMLWFSIVFPAYKMFRTGGTERQDYFFVFVFVSFIVCLFSNFFQPNLAYTVTETFYCFFGGVAAARCAQIRSCLTRL